MDQSETGTLLKIRVLNCTKKEIQRDIERASEFDQSALFKKIIRSRFDHLSVANPFGALIGDFEFSKHPQDMSNCWRASPGSGGGACAVYQRCEPHLLGWDNYQDLTEVRAIWRKDF